MSPTRDQACNPDMCPHLELNQQHYVLRMILNQVSYTSQGNSRILKVSFLPLSLMNAYMLDTCTHIRSCSHIHIYANYLDLGMKVELESMVKSLTIDHNYGN